MTFAGSPRRCPALAALEMVVTLFVFQVPHVTTLWRLAGVAVLRLSSVSFQPQVVTSLPKAPVPRWCRTLLLLELGYVLTVINGGFSPLQQLSHTTLLRVRKVFPSRLLPALHRPCILSTTHGSATLCPLPASAIGAYSVQFYGPLGDLRNQSSRASLGKALRPPHIPSASTSVRYFRILGLAHSRLLDPAPRSHIGGSLFATYVGSTSCFLSTRHLCRRSCPVGVVLPSGNGGQFYFRDNVPEDQS